MAAGGIDLTVEAAQGVPSSLLALVTTVHVALLMLRRYRGVRSPAQAGVLIPSLALAVMTWMFPQAQWVAAGLAAHLAWFAACEKLLPKPAARGGARPASAPLAEAPARSPAAAPATAASAGFQPVPVLAVFDETPDIRTFRTARPPGFEVAPGQFLTVKVQVDGKPLVRCYSISSCPASAGYLEISVKRQGTVSGMLHSTVRPGSLLSVKRPNGRFTYPGGDDRPLVLLAGGVGVTPLMSMLRHAVAADPARPVTLVLAVRTERDVAFRRELEWLAERHPQLKVAVAVSGGPLALVGRAPAGVERLAGRVTESVVRRLVPDPGNTIFMICGPAPMMGAMRGLLSALGVPSSQVRFEAFEAAIAMSREDGAPARGGAAAGAARAGAGPALALRRTGVTVTVAPEQTLLDAAEAGGAEIPSSCRAGVCMTCRTRLLEGEVECSSDSLDDDDRAEGYVLPCVSWAKGDCALDA